jgi:hypothetical protein
MAGTAQPPVGAKLHSDIERRCGAGGDSYRARVRWYDPTTGKRRSKSETFADDDAAQSWIESLCRAAAGGVDPERFTQTLREYGDSVMSLAFVASKPRPPILTWPAGADASFRPLAISPSG